MPYSLVLERASGTHIYSVQQELSLLTSTCSVVCLLPQAYSNKLRLAALEAHFVSFSLVPCSAAERNGHKHGFCYRGGCPGIEEASICLFAEKKAAKPIFLTVLWPMQPVFILSMPAGYNTLTVFSFSQLRKHLRPAHNHCLPNRNSEWALPLLLNNVQT